MDAHGLPLTAAREALLDALAVLLPVVCAGCGCPDRGLCASCGATLLGLGAVDTIELRPGPSLPTPQTGEGLARDEGMPLWFSTQYAGVVATVLHALKESGRTDAARPLGALLRPALQQAVEVVTARLPPGEQLELLVIPSSGRSFGVRGYNPVESLLRWAGPQPRRATGIRFRRTPKDQAALGVHDRWQNLEGSLVGSARRLAGRHLLIVDDVVTTGATLLECRRAAVQAGAQVWGGIALAHTAKVKRTNSELLGDFDSPRVYGGGKGAESNRPRLGRRVLD
ncbi:ComF family protein [Agreia sp. COWG]|uniref:ComF family protein n=1 Tax=Agreia sp. COWG TaxID=2773266 RepID=UPI001928175D|nr:ComF family protein [Agreia sp. COWG]